MSTLKKICFVLPEFSSDTHFTYVATMIEILSKDHDIFLLVEKGEIKKDTQIKKIYKQKFSFLPLRALENFLILLWARVSGYKQIYVHYSFVSAISASLIARTSRGRAFYWNAGLPWQYKRSSIRVKFEKLTYHLISYLVTGTETLRREYAKHYNISEKKIKVIPNWIDIQAFNTLPGDFSPENFKKELQVAPDQRVVLFVHRLARRKGSHFLPAIAEALKQKNAVLIIVGDGPEKANLEKELVEKNLLKQTRIRGRASQEEVKKYFRIANVFVMPSEEEGFPHVILEAMAAHVPYVAFDVGGMQDIITPLMKQYVCPPNDIQSFVHQLLELLDHEEIRQDLIRSGDARVQDFSKQKVTEEFRQLFIS